MKAVIRWAVHNSPAMNTLMLAVLIMGGTSLWTMRREMFPEFELEIILVSVPYPNASPAEVEEGICQKIEEAVASIGGIKKRTSVAQKNAGFVVIELETSVSDVQKVLNEIRSEIDRIPSFPQEAEDPDVKQLTLRNFAIRVGVLAPDSNADDPTAELRLREVAERVRDDLLHLKTVSQANILGAKDYQIDIEIEEKTLREYGLTLQQVGQIVRRENVELPSGTLKTDSQEVLLRGKNKRNTGVEIAQIPLITQPNGVVLTVGDLAVVRDEFVDTASINQINGRSGMVISIDRASNEDLLAIAEDVRAYVKTAELPYGYALTTWADQSVDVRDRLELLGRNGLQGLVLVFIVLAIFLNLRLAFWVALGVPVAILGACSHLLYADQTLNMLTMFAFLMAIGIIVDDAIVVGENIFAHRQRGKSLHQAAIDGTYEVLPAVIASVCTTIIAFVPLMYVSGIMGKFIAIMPVAVIAMLIISLLESTFILPSHLAGEHHGFFRIIGIAFYPFRIVGDLFAWLNRWATRILEKLLTRVYMPALRWSLDHAELVFCGAVSMLLLTAGCIAAGVPSYVLFPKIDSKWIMAQVVFPDGTPATVTDAATRKLEKTIRQVNDQLSSDGNPVIKVLHRAVGELTSAGSLGPNTRSSGAHVGVVNVELVDPELREEDSTEILAAWRKATGRIAGIETLNYTTPDFGPGGKSIEFKLLAPAEKMDQLEAAIELCKQELHTQRGVYDISDDSRPGKWEFQISVKQAAESMHVSNADLMETVRAAYYGYEVMRLQRGRHEVKLMVRYPRHERRSLASFDEIRVRLDDGAERPITELADVKVEAGYSEINRVNQLRAITITADVDESTANASKIITQMQKEFIPKLLKEFPDVRIRWEGQREQSRESMASMRRGFIIALIGMFVLLTLMFRSYFQPLLILSIIPFGAIGAVIGHALMGIPLSFFSMFGMVALTGVVVNDSIVLVDFINRKVRGGMPLKQSLLEAGLQRFRPVLLTSVTTIVGLLPMLTETSFQAQILIPMAVTIVFGLAVATILVLILVPVFYLIYYRITHLGVGQDAAFMPSVLATHETIVHRPDDGQQIPTFGRDDDSDGKKEKLAR